MDLTKSVVIPENLIYEAPVKPYVWGMTYEVRDKFNRTVIRAEVMKGDLHYRKNLEILIHVLAGLMNGENWIENGIDGYKVSGFGVGNAEQRIPFPGGDVNRKIAESI